MENWLKGLATKAKDAIGGAEKKVADWFAPSANGVRVRDVAREVPGATVNVAKDIAKGLVRVPLSAGEAVVSAPMDAYAAITGKPSKVPIYKPETIPGLGFLGPIESYQNQVRRDVSQGESPLKATGKAAFSVATDEPTGLAFKPLGLAVGAFMKAGGGKAAEEAVNALVKATKPEEVKAILEGFGVGKKAVSETADALAKASTKEDVMGILTGTKGATQKAAAKAVSGKTKAAPKAAPVSRETVISGDPLAAEAKKYKSADSFIKAQGRTLYHGSSKADIIRKEGFKLPTSIAEQTDAPAYGEGVYFSTKRGGAYDNTRSGVNTIEGYIPKDAKLFPATEKDAFSLKTKDLKAQGYDGIEVSLPGGEKHVVVFDPKKIRTREDLTSIYDKVHGTNTEILPRGLKPLQALARKSKSADEFIANAKLNGDIAQTLKERYTGNNIEDLLKDFYAKMSKVAKPTTEVPSESVGSMRSVGDILAGKGGDVRPPIEPPKTAKAPIPNGAERKFITRSRDLAPEMDQYLKGKYTPKSNKELTAKAEDLIKNDYAAAEQLARTGTSDEAVATASRLIDSLINDARKAEGTAADALYEKAATIANDAAKNLTEAGRAVQAASLLGRMTPEGMVRYAARQIQRYNEQAGSRTLRNFLGAAKKIPNLSADDAKVITDRMIEINKMPEGIDKAKAVQKLMDDVRSKIPSSLYSKIIALWKAGLLTGLKTSGLNTIANASHAASEAIKDVPAAAIDRVLSLFTGKRTLALTGKGELKGMKEGVAKGWDYLKTGFDERDVAAKLDHNKVNFGNSKIAKALQAYEETIFRTIGAEDQPFYYGAKARSLYSQAIAAAKNEGLKGKAAKSFIENLVANPTDDMLKYAVLDAETSVFQNKTALGGAARAIQNLPGGQIVLPFGKTPAAVATQMINYTPVGIAKTIIENIGKGRFDQRLLAQGIGRGLTGTAALAIGMALMRNKMLSLSYPTSTREREQWQLEGRQPNSIKIGGKWRNIGILGPIGMVLVIGGHLQQGIDDTGSWAGGLAEAAGGAGSALTEQSFLKGVNQAIDALNDPQRSFNGFASSLAGSVVPTIVSDIARATDTYERTTTSPIQRTISRIPGLRENLQPQIDTLGNKQKTPNFFETMADATRPGNPSANINDTVVKELRRLMDAGYPATPTQLGGSKGYGSLTPEQNTRLQNLGGEYVKQNIEDVMKRSAYQKYDDELKAKEINQAVDDAKVEARAHIVYDAVKDLPQAEKMKKLGEMKDDGLLTKQVYSYYLSLARRGK